MATDSCHRVIEVNIASTRFSNSFDRIHFILAGNDGIHKKFGQIRPWTTKLAALECLKNIPYSDL